MAKNKIEHQDTFENVENALTKTERYIEENQKSLTIIVIIAIFIIGGYLAFTKFYIAPKEKEAQSQLFVAEQYFEKDSFNLALEGVGNYPGFLQIIDEYKLTKSANLAHYYAGVSYLQLGQFEDAIKYLKKFDSSDKMLAPIAIGAIGDANMELGNTKEAISFYTKAANFIDNKFTTPLYLMKAGLAYEENSELEMALKTYKRIEKDYPSTTEGRQIEKYIAKIENKLN